MAKIKLHSYFIKMYYYYENATTTKTFKRIVKYFTQWTMIYLDL